MEIQVDMNEVDEKEGVKGGCRVETYSKKLRRRKIIPGKRGSV